MYASKVFGWMNLLKPTQIDPSVLNMLKSAGVGPDGFVNFTKKSEAMSFGKKDSTAPRLLSLY